MATKVVSSKSAFQNDDDDDVFLSVKSFIKEEEEEEEVSKKKRVPTIISYKETNSSLFLRDFTTTLQLLGILL